MMYLFCILMCIISCFITYKVTCHRMIELDKNNVKAFDMHQEFLSKSLDEIADLKIAVLQIKKDIYQ